MNRTIRILILEDVAADVVRINHELRKAGLSFCSKRVETREDFLRELQHNTPDIILSDHGLPSFDGFTALAIAKDQCPEVPFIFVTGSLGERKAVETVKSGAADYVLKERPADLVPAVQRALREAENSARRRESDALLKANDERFRLVMGGIKDYAIFTLDLGGHITFWNAGAQWIYGWRLDEVLGRDASMLYSDQDVVEGKPEMAMKTAAAEERFAEESLRIAKGGKVFTANVVTTALRDGRGKLRGYTQVTSDITKHAQVEATLRKSEALKTAILDTALDAILSIDQNGFVQEWNAAAQRIFGYPRNQVLGKPVDDLIIPKSLSELYDHGLADYLIHGVGSLLGRPIDLTLKRNDGSEFPAELAISRVTAEEPPRCTALIRDITERKNAEAALRASEEHYRMLVEHVKDYAIYMLDPEGRVATWNAGAERITGYSTNQVSGKSYAVFFTPEDIVRKVPAQLLKRAEKEGRAVYEGQRVRKNGRRFWIEGIITALFDADNRLRGFSKVARDVTRQRDADEKIRQLNEQLENRVIERTTQLEAANKELEAFSYSISHDLRAPLLHISGYANILQNEASNKLDTRSRKHLEIITEGAGQMSRLIDALLEFSRTGRAEMRRERIQVTRLVAEARYELQREMEGRDIDWRIGKLPDARGDPAMLRQVLINLISNALKYTRPRSRAKIEVGVLIENNETQYFVRDNGIGFDMAYASKLFRVFQRLHPAREFPGVGIGLANVQRIIQRHGGRVWAEGVVDQGAAFYFSLPHH